MKYKTGKNWIDSFEQIKKRPVIILPFIIIAFLEGLALEFIYFFPRKPISFVFNPIVSKFSGEAFTHYPGNLILLPKLHYYGQIVIYCLIGVFLAAISINIFKNIKSKLPLKTKALINNATKRYLSFLVYGILMVGIVFILKKIDFFILSKIFRFASRYIPDIAAKSYPLIAPIFLFLTNIIVQVFLILTLPIIVIKNKNLLKALLESINLGIRNFFTLFILISIPFLIYLPISLLKSFQLVIINKTFPEITLYITTAGIIVAIFIDCFIVICASQFLLDKEKDKA